MRDRVRVYAHMRRGRVDGFVGTGDISAFRDAVRIGDGGIGAAQLFHDVAF